MGKRSPKTLNPDSVFLTTIFPLLPSVGRIIVIVWQITNFAQMLVVSEKRLFQNVVEGVKDEESITRNQS